MSKSVSIRRAQPAEAKIIAGFQQAMAIETEDKVLPESVIVNGVQRLMDRPELGFYLVAESAGEVVGSLMITFEWTDWRNGLFWWIQSVYVRPDARRQGIYSSLYRYAQDLAADDQDVRGIRLYVEVENVGAQKTYEKLGMARCQYQMYESLFDAGSVE